MNYQPEPNVALDGDDARILMNALVTSDSHAPTNATIKLYLKLNQINTVQPPAAVAPPPEPTTEQAETPRKRTRKTR